MKKGQVKYSRRYLPHRYPKSYRERKEISWKRRIIFFWILFLILVLVYILFFSPIFEIKEINISGNRVISNEEIRSVLNQGNLFLVTKNKLRNTLVNNFPRIASVDVTKDIFKKSIDLKIIERKEVGIFCKKDCYYIDKQGVIFEKAPQTSGALILVIKDYSEGELGINRNVVERGFIAELIDLRNYLSDQLGLKVLEFMIGSGASEDLKVNTNEGWHILFDRSRDLQNQIEALRLVLEEKIKEERTNLEYIDLRIENRVYYK